MKCRASSESEAPAEPSPAPVAGGLDDHRAPPELAPHERADQMLAWTRSQEGLKRFLPLLPVGSTLSDALRVHRAMRQSGRQPSKVMQEPEP